MSAWWRVPFGGITLAGLLALAPPPAVDPVAEEATDPASLIAMAITDTDQMTVPIHIAGTGPYPFIVDTAATRTVVSRQLATVLKLQPTGSTRMLTLTGDEQAGLVRVPKLMFRPGQTHDVEALAIGGTHIGAHGILGIDTLQDQRVVLDFRARTLTVSRAPRRWERPADPDEIVVTARRKFGQLIIADSDVDGEKVDVIVDTGIQVSIGNAALRRHLLRAGHRYPIMPITMISVTGDVLNADYTRVDRLRIGRMALKGMPIAFADAYPFRKLKLRRPALLLGMDALQMFPRVTVDFANRKASFVLPEPPQVAQDTTR